MPTRNINLTDRLDDFVARQVSSGRYGNASEIVREALRLLEVQHEERRIKLKALRSAAKSAFREIDEGKGIAIKNRKKLKSFISNIADEVGTMESRAG
jgi:antitoxin ParD1/3/4